MADLSTEALIALIVALLLLSSVFSASETAVFCLDRLRLGAQRDSRTAKRLLDLIDNPDKTLSLILVCNNVCNITCSALVTILTTHLYGEAAVAAAVGILTLIVLVFAELTPKTLAAMRPELFAYPIAWTFPFLIKLLYPVLVGIRAAANATLYPLNRLSAPPENRIGAEELRVLLSSTKVKLPKRRTRLMLNILDFEKLCVEDVMVPRSDIKAIDLSQSWTDVLEQIKMYTYSDLLFCEESLDNITGSCNCRSLLDLLVEGRLNEESLRGRIEKPTYAVEGTRLSRVIASQGAAKSSRLILVLNEYDSLQGLLTRNDILKRINPDRGSGDSGQLRKESERVYLADAAMRVEALNTALGISLPTANYITLNGLVTNHLESIPGRGVSTQINGVTFEIVKSLRNQVLLLRVVLPPGDESPAEDDEKDSD